MFSEFCGLSRQSRLRGLSCSSHFISQTHPIYCCCVFVFILVVFLVGGHWGTEHELRGDSFGGTSGCWCEWALLINKELLIIFQLAEKCVSKREETVWPWVTPITPSALRIGWGNCISELTHTFIFCSCLFF